jgi:REP element-mobilizing transposase RayT
MSVRKEMPFKEGVYFITFTCYKWLLLIDMVDAYGEVYKQFDILKSEGHFIIGYVIMPNHVHSLIAFRDIGKSINRRVGTVKRFLAYELVERLKQSGKHELLEELKAGVNNTDKSRGKLHEVFEPSFDCKECFSDNMINQKLDYMHDNPCQGVWQLVDSPVNYKHSSALFYITGQQGVYPVTHYMELEDIDLTKH